MPKVTEPTEKKRYTAQKVWRLENLSPKGKLKRFGQNNFVLQKEIINFSLLLRQTDRN